MHSNLLHKCAWPCRLWYRFQCRAAFRQSARCSKHHQVPLHLQRRQSDNPEVSIRLQSSYRQNDERESCRLRSNLQRCWLQEGCKSHRKLRNHCKVKLCTRDSELLWRSHQACLFSLTKRVGASSSLWWMCLKPCCNLVQCWYRHMQRDVHLDILGYRTILPLIHKQVLQSVSYSKWLSDLWQGSTSRGCAAPGTGSWDLSATDGFLCWSWGYGGKLGPWSGGNQLLPIFH